jgi:dTDP-4-dehydrorhamnose reductase
VKALLFGARGLLGGEIQRQRPATHALTALTRTEVDVRDADAVRAAIRDTAPDWVINASGYTNVDGAELEPDVAFDVNARAVGDMARLCREQRCGMLHFSTDYVFDGTKSGFYTEDDAPRPINAYGAGKLAGEVRVRESGARHLIVRTQWLYGAEGKSFVSTLRERAAGGMPTRVVDDQFGCCTYSVDLARTVWTAVGRLEGLFHVANRGRVSRYMMARQVFAAAGASEALSACHGAEFPAVARRPANSPLDVSKVEAALRITMPPWTDALARYLSERPHETHVAPE